MCIKDIKCYKFVCVWVEFLAFNVSLHTKYEQKVIGDLSFTICVERVWIVIGYFLIEKQTFD